MFTSLLNVVCAYDPVGYGVPYNHIMFQDTREPLVEAALQVLCVTMEAEAAAAQNVSVDGTSGGTAMEQQGDVCTETKNAEVSSQDKTLALHI